MHHRPRACPFSLALIVDDYQTNRFLLKLLLGRLGCEVQEAADGLEAIEKLSREPFDLILTDIRMPGMDGLEMTRCIRERWPDRHLAIVGVTADALPEDRQACLAAGMDEVLAKPVMLEDLQTAFDRFATIPGEPSS